MRQEEYIEKINGVLNQILNLDLPVHERWSLSGEYSHLLAELLEQYPNDATFEFMIEVIRKLYNKKTNNEYDDFKVIDCTLLGMYAILGK